MYLRIRTYRGRGNRTTTTTGAAPRFVAPSPGQDYQQHGHVARQQPITPGCQKAPLTTLATIRSVWQKHPESVLVVSDVHADLAGLHQLLMEVGAVDSAAQRRPGTGQLVQIGDLVDGRDVNDTATAEYGLRVFDRWLAGNHEGALLGGKPFTGQWDQPETTMVLKQAIREEKLQAALAVGDTLLVHGGAHPAYWPQGTAQDAAAAINEAWEQWWWRQGDSRNPPAPLFEHTEHGGRGGTGEHGGALWCDWRQLAQQTTQTPFRQIVGHSPLGTPEQRDDHQFTCIDTAGPRLGLAWIHPDGRQLFATDETLR